MFMSIEELCTPMVPQSVKLQTAHADPRLEAMEKLIRELIGDGSDLNIKVGQFYLTINISYSFSVINYMFYPLRKSGTRLPAYFSGQSEYGRICVYNTCSGIWNCTKYQLTAAAR